MEWTKEMDGDILSVDLKGELDLQSSRSLERDLNWELQWHREIKILLINCTHLQFIDSTGIGTLLKQIRGMDARHGKVYITGIPSHIQKVLRMAGVLRLVTVYPSKKKALHSLNHGGGR